MTTGSEPQGTHFWFMSFMVRNRLGLAMEERSGHWSPPSGITRFDAFNEVRRQVIAASPDLAAGALVSFDIQLNRLTEGDPS